MGYETTKKPVYNPPKTYKPPKTTPKPVYNPPKKQACQESSYAPPAPTYKPKPTYKPAEKPKYNPPPAPTQAPHIIYAGHPPIHIYQQPQVHSIKADPPTYGAPKQV